MLDSLFQGMAHRVALAWEPFGHSKPGAAIRDGLVQSRIFGGREIEDCRDCYGLPECGVGWGEDVCTPDNYYCPGCWYSDCGYWCCDYWCDCVGQCIHKE
jgi:hypothetical protein